MRKINNMKADKDIKSNCGWCKRFISNPVSEYYCSNQCLWRQVKRNHYNKKIFIESVMLEAQSMNDRRSIATGELVLIDEYGSVLN